MASEKQPIVDETTAINKECGGPAELEEPRCYVPKRYCLAVLAFFGMFNIYALRVNMSVAIVAMVNNKTDYVRDRAGRDFNVTEPAEFKWDSGTQGVILSSFFYGYFITQIPGGYIASRWNAKVVFGAGVLVAALMTLLTPVAARAGIVALVIVRGLVGAGSGVTFPSMQAVWSNWAPPLERTKLITMSFSGAHIGTVCATLIAGKTAADVGWPAVFYILAALAVIWTVFWFLFARNTPADHSAISPRELAYIVQSIGYSAGTRGDSSLFNSAASVPWFAMLRSSAVWAIVAVHFAWNFGFYTMFTLLPKYMNDVLHYDIVHAGILESVPYFFLAILMLLAGYLSDWALVRATPGSRLTVTYVRKMSVCPAMLLQAVFVVLITYVGSARASVVCVSLVIALGGVVWAGFTVNQLDVGAHYAGILMGISNTFATLGAMLAPLIGGQLVAHKTTNEWRAVFCLVGAFYLVGALVYAFFASGDRQKWADEPAAFYQQFDAKGETIEVNRAADQQQAGNKEKQADWN